MNIAIHEISPGRWTVIGKTTLELDQERWRFPYYLRLKIQTRGADIDMYHQFVVIIILRYVKDAAVAGFFMFLCCYYPYYQLLFFLVSSCFCCYSVTDFIIIIFKYLKTSVLAGFVLLLLPPLIFLVFLSITTVALRLLHLRHVTSEHHHRHYITSQHQYHYHCHISLSPATPYFLV